MKAAVIGGGLAGLAAALDLADAGAEVTLIEGRPTLGGAVQTLPERDGDPSPPPDNGQHVALGCFTEYLRFIERIGQGRSIRRLRLSLPVIDEQGHAAVLGAGPGAVLAYRHLSLRDRIGVARVVRRLAHLRPELHDGETFAGLLRRLGSSQQAIDRFWEVFIRPALNLRSQEASAALGLFTVQTALLGPRANSDLLLPVAPLGVMHGDAAGRALEAAGVVLRLRTRAVSLDDGAVVLAEGERVQAAAIVLALPPVESARILGEVAPRLGDSPIVSVHLLVDPPLLQTPMAALLESPAQWVFDRGSLTGHPPERGQYLTVVASGAPELAAIRGRALVDLMAEALMARLGSAELIWSRVSREPEATFAARPGTWTRRPGAATGRPGIVRAGAWTQTGWPATMEGAIRSGRTAARQVLNTSTPARVAR